MKASASTITASHTVERAGLGVFLELSKARLTTLVLLTALVGYYIGHRGPMTAEAWWLLLHTVLGTALVASGASALNQLLEKDYDARMRRTETRPLPSGRVQPETVLIFGGACAAVGLAYLAFAVNLLTAALGAITFASYLFIYTPLKRVTPLNTIVGAIPGALPPLMGWTAARDQITVEGWALFAILFFWQLPHFMAIAWLYREDYARAGYMMLPVVDPHGFRTGPMAVSYTLGLLPISLSPFLFRLSGPVYLVGALLLSLAFVWFAIRFSRSLLATRARHLFYASIIYLPVLLMLMVFDKVK